jgi:hypothetical protein
MRALVSLLVLSLTPAYAGDLWLVLDQDEDGTNIHVELPANWIADEDVTVDINGTPTALGPIAADLRTRRTGATQEFTIDDDDGPIVATLEHRKVKKHGADQIELRVGADGGFGMGMQMELDGGGISGKLVADQLSGSLALDGFDLGLDDTEFVAQLRRAPPTVLLSAKDDDGLVVVATR